MLSLADSHSPHGECGLKYGQDLRQNAMAGSLPAWGVRVEINCTSRWRPGGASLPAWGARVEICRARILRLARLSLPAWGVRVEIPPTAR